jgi:hypothetical protein
MSAFYIIKGIKMEGINLTETPEIILLYPWEPPPQFI